MTSADAKPGVTTTSKNAHHAIQRINPRLFGKVAQLEQLSQCLRPRRARCKQRVMGAWDLSPWDNDSAADWFGNLFEELPLAAKVEATLNLDPDLHHEEIRAAAALLIMLGRTYNWPIEALDRHLTLAIERMEALRPVYQGLDGEDLVSALDSEIAILKSRLANDSTQPAPLQPSSWSDFW